MSYRLSAICANLRPRIQDAKDFAICLSPLPSLDNRFRKVIVKYRDFDLKPEPDIKQESTGKATGN